MPYDDETDPRFRVHWTEWLPLLGVFGLWVYVVLHG